MSITLRWSCTECGKGAETSNAKLLTEQAEQHRCDAFMLIHKAARHYRQQGRAVDIVIAKFLEDTASELLKQGHRGRESFFSCDEPGAAKLALDIADALNEVPF